MVASGQSKIADPAGQRRAVLLDLFKIDILAHGIFGGRGARFTGGLPVWLAGLTIHVGGILHIAELLPDMPGRSEDRQKEIEYEPVREVEYNPEK
jgi:hypothetical protein